MRYTNNGISQLALGTAGLMASYAGQAPPKRDEAVALVMSALADGCTLIDTAPAYHSEELLAGLPRVNNNGRTIFVATKIRPYAYSRAEVRMRLAASRKALRRDALDMVQLHNPSPADFGGLVLDELREEQARGNVLLIGASVYTEAEALRAIAAKVDAIQVPYSLLDQRMAELVFERARAAGVEVLARSVWLRGALAGGQVPTKALRAARVAQVWLLARRKELPGLALRFALRGPTSLVVGPRSVAEWDAAVRAANRGPLGVPRRWLAAGCASDDPLVYDPRLWDGQ